jgi:glutamine synthetase
MGESAEFIEKHGLWTDGQRRQAREVMARLDSDGIRLVRVAWADPHGASRVKMLTTQAFKASLSGGYNINMATATLDGSGARIFSSFTRGGGMGLPEMTGSPNLVIVPDPATFRVLPWEPDVGWILCDDYFGSGQPFYFSPRHLLRKQLQRLRERSLRLVVGLEVEWYLLRLSEERLSDEHIGAPGTKGRALRAHPVEPGYSLHSETGLDLMHGPLSELARAYQKLDLPVRSFENEWGPGQVECTFAPAEALQAADDMLLFRTATRQLCRRMGYLASFMCRPKLKGLYPSGWHLHQSVVETGGGANIFTPTNPGESLSPVGKAYLGGLLHHALAATVLANPTVNAYRRFRANSLAPDRLTWGIDHRGALLRVLGGVGDPATRIENRIGEPAANPYLYIASQIISGLDGIDNARDPGAADTDPYSAGGLKLPNRLLVALEMLEQDPLFRRELGDRFIDYYLAFKRTEAGRFTQYLNDNNLDPSSDEVTDWEQDEYFDFF